jgi:hypothetical protein
MTMMTREGECSNLRRQIPQFAKAKEFREKSPSPLDNRYTDVVSLQCKKGKDSE